MKTRFFFASRVVVCVLVVFSGCSTDPTPESVTPATLKEAFADAFMMGAALNPNQFTERDSEGAALIKAQFNTITPENVMKWEQIHPEPGVYTFEQADQFVAFGETNDMFMVGHTLVWHSQTPVWVFEDGNGGPASRDTLISRMRDHIYTVVGRYKGRVHAWDVVNEALNEDGSLRESPWYQIIGEDYLSLAFQFAHEADPDAELFYNDYTLENPAKRDGAIRMVQTLLDQGHVVTGIGTQGHHLLGAQSPSIQNQIATIEAFAALGVDVMVTELDIAVLPRPQAYWGADISQRAELSAELNPYIEALPDSMQQALANRYAALFEAFVAHKDKISRITFWGVTDGDSWLNHWPISGRTTDPLLFDRAYQPKPAFDAVMETAP